MYTNFAEVTCPACFQVFSVALPAPEELPTELDYDCEVCCRPMLIAVWIKDDGEPSAEARAIND